MHVCRRFALALLPALLMTMFVAAPAFAQAQALDGVIEGFVKTQVDGRPLPGATVRAFNGATGYERSVVSDDSGRYGLPLLPPGEYVIFVEAPSFATISKTAIVLRAGQTLTIEFEMSTSSFAETVQVTAAQSTVEVGRTVQSNNYDERTVRAIPTIGRSILDFFVLQPGVNAPPISSGGSGTGTPSTVYGGLGLRQMNVDGVSNNLQGGARNLVISQEAVEQFQTVTNFSAEFGRVVGGLQNAFTRSGGNATHGSAYLVTRQDWLSARPFLLAPTAPQPEFQRYNFGGTAGGPIVRDRSFYFVSYERWSQDLPVVSTITPANAAALGIPPTSGGSGYVYVKDAADHARVQQLLMEMKKHPANGIREVWNSTELAAKGAHPDAAFGIDVIDGFYTGGGHDVLIKTSGGKGGHGFDPMRQALHSSFILSGPAVQRRGSVGVIKMTQIAPTLALILEVGLSPSAAKPLTVSTATVTSAPQRQ